MKTNTNQIILNLLSAHLKGGRGNPNITGFNKPLSNAVFFCHSKIQAVVNRLHSVMAGLFRELERVAVPVSVFPPLFNPAAYVVENISSGLHPQNTGITAMTTSVIKLINELKSEIAALRAEIAALKAEKIQKTSENPAKTAAVAPKTSDCILRLPQVLKMIGLSRSAVYLKIKQGLFPKQVKLGMRAAGWFESQVIAFMQSLSTVGGVA